MSSSNDFFSQFNGVATTKVNATQYGGTTTQSADHAAQASDHSLLHLSGVDVAILIGVVNFLIITAVLVVLLRKRRKGHLQG